MKKLFRKRGLAYLIDIFVFAFIYELFREVVEGFVSITTEWGYFIVIMPFVLRDLTFRNGSIGKKIVGLVVVDDKWNVPDVWTVIKRSAITSLGHVLLYGFKLRNESWKMACFAELEWEYNSLKAHVVEKKVFNALKPKASVDGTLDIVQMKQLYDQYLGKTQGQS